MNGSQIRAALALLLALAASGPQRASALTADEVLKLREAGVSDETIQQMLSNEAAKQQQGGASAQMQQQKFANDHIGSWTTSDGRVVLSTGRADPAKDVFDPTVPGSGNDYPMSVYPYVFPGGAPGPPGPVMGPHGPLGPGPGPR